MELSLAAARARFHSSADSMLYYTPRVTVIATTDADTGEGAVWKEVLSSPACAPFARREAAIHSQLSHQFINPFLASCEWESEGEFHFVIVSKRQTHDLSEEIDSRRSEGRPWVEEEVVKLMGMTISALAYCQFRKIAHRDLKPHNIFLTEDGTVVVGDFGLAREVEEEMSVRGTMYYISPEIRKHLQSAKETEYDAFKSDVYSLGITMLQLCSLKSDSAMSDFCVSDGLPYVIYEQIHQLSYSDKVKFFLEAMLEVDPSQRPDWVRLAKMYMSTWPGHSALFNMQDFDTRVCSSCQSYTADYVCLCDSPPPLLCFGCWPQHDVPPKAHKQLSIAQVNDFRSETDVIQARASISQLENLRVNLEIARETIQRLIETQQNLLHELIEELNSQEKSLRVSLEELSESVNYLLFRLRDIQTTGVSRDFAYLERLSQVPAPYFRHNSTSPRSLTAVSKYESISSLLAADFPLRFPLFEGEYMTIHCPKFATRLERRKLAVPIDDETAITRVDFDRIAVCGGQESPSQVCLIQIGSNAVVFRSELSVPRRSPGIISKGDCLFVFAGREEKSAEAVEYAGAQRKLCELRWEHSRCSPCEHKLRVFLPGPVVEVYYMETNSVSDFARIAAVSAPVAAVAAEGKLFIFLKDCMVYRKIEEEDPWKRVEKAGVQFYCRPNPEVVGSVVYFFGSNGTLLKFHLDARRKSVAESQ